MLLLLVSTIVNDLKALYSSSEIYICCKVTCWFNGHDDEATIINLVALCYVIRGEEVFLTHEFFKLTRNPMGSNSNVYLPHFKLTETITIIRNKIIYDSSVNSCSLTMNRDIMFNN